MNRLKDALKEVAKRVERENMFKGNRELSSANTKAFELFSAREPIIRQPFLGPPINVRFMSLRRVNRYCQRRGINWPVIDWDLLVEWLYNNWDKILRVLMSLLILI